MPSSARKAQSQNILYYLHSKLPLLWDAAGPTDHYRNVGACVCVFSRILLAPGFPTISEGINKHCLQEMLHLLLQVEL